MKKNKKDQNFREKEKKNYFFCIQLTWSLKIKEYMKLEVKFTREKA